MKSKTIVPISDVLWFQEGPGVRNTQYTTEGVKLLNVANLVDGRVDLTVSDRYISEEEAFGKYKHFLCDDGDFIVASSGIKVDYIDKKMGFVDESMLPLCMNTSTIRFKVCDNTRMKIRYFMYYLKSHHFKEQLYKYITGSAQLNYGPSHLKKMVMPLFSLVEQDEIIGKLDKIQFIIDLNQHKLKKLDDLIKAQFVEMFGDKGYPLVEVGKLLKQNANVEKIKDTKTEKFVTVAVRGGGARQRVIKDGKWPVPFSGYRVKANQFIYSRIDARNGAFAILPDVLDGAVVSKDFPIFDVDTTKILPSVFLSSLLEERFLKQIQNSSFGATNRQRIQEDTFARYTISLAPIEVQTEYEQFVNQCDKSKVAIQKQIDKYQLLFDSLMQQYFG